jgi:hypothetical protein
MLEKSGRDPLTVTLLELRTAMDDKTLKNIHIADSRCIKLITVVYIPTNR